VDWSRDGRFLMFMVDSPKTGPDLWVLPMTGTGDRKPFPVLDTRFAELEGVFSPNGRWISYASDESGHQEIYVRTFPEADGKWEVSSAGGVAPRWSPDGKELFYVARDGRLMAVPIRVEPDGKTIKPGEPLPLFQTSLSRTAGAYSRPNYCVAPDGR